MKKYRNEWKYSIKEGSLSEVESRISAVLEKDPFYLKRGVYRIHSLYFDDYKNKCAKENEAGDFKRYKWRIRYYNNNLDYIKLEYKEKTFGMCHKKSCTLSLEEYNQIISNDVSDLFWNTDKDLLKKFCIDIMTKIFAPKVIIDYERRPYVEPISNIRITLDMNISASYEFDKFLTGDYQCFPIQENGFHVLEVKFDYILPSYIKNIVSSDKFIQTSFSKYYLGRKKIEEVF